MSVKVQRIELYNFKSYSGRITIGPFHDFTCIVGPNGSGKSNVMDALSFVLGSSAATLRGQNVSDFICRKSKAKECSVALVLRLANGTETKLMRGIDAKGNLTLHVDKVAVNEKEFHAVLKKYRLGSRISSFLVFQHEVDAVAQKKARELTELLEIVSGSVELKDEYNAKRKALDTANEALAAASLEKRGAVAEVNQMRLHKKEAERFEDIHSKVENERRDLAMVELFFIECALTKKKDELQRLQNEVKALEKGLASEDDVRAMKKVYAEKHKAYMEHLKSNRNVNIDLRDKKANLERLAISLKHLQQRAEDQRSELKQVQAASTVRSKETQRLEEQLKQQEALLKQFESECAKEDAELGKQGTLTPQQMTEYRQLKKEADCQTISLRQELESVTRQRDSLAEGLKQATASLENREKQKKDAQQNIERTNERMAELERRVHESTRQLEELRERETRIRGNIAQAVSLAKEREDELARVQQQLGELRFAKDDNRHSTKMSDALQALKSLFPHGIRGRLVDLCEIPNAKYRAAVTVAFGKNLEAVVVDTTDTAMACVRYLKEQRLVAMTFLPMNSVQGKGVDDSLRTFGGSARPIVDVIKFDPTLDPALRYAVGQTIVCDSTEEARRIAYGQPDGQRYKVVTVDGTVLLKNGSIQGGLASIQSRARKWDEKKYDDLKAARDRLVKEVADGSETELAKNRVELKDIQSRVEFGTKRLEALRAEIEQLKAKVASLTAQISTSTSQDAELQKRVTHYRTGVAKCESEMEAKQKSIRALEHGIFKDFEKKVNVPNITELDVRETKLAKQRAEKRQQFQLIIQKLKNSIDAEVKRIGVRSVSDVEASLAKTTKELEVCTKDLKAYTDITKSLEQKQATLQSNITSAKAALDQLEEDIRKNSKASEEEVRKLAQSRKHANTVQASCEALRLQRVSLFQRCRMEQTDLPTCGDNNGGGKRPRASEATTAAPPSKKRGGGGGGAAHATEELLVNVSESFSTYAEADTSSSRRSGGGGAGATRDVQVSIDFSGLPDALRQHAKDAATFAAYKTRATAQLDQMERELESIAPNLKATARFGTTESKLGATSAVLDEAREKARKSLAEFLRVKELRVQRFMETFEKIAECVDRVYRDLTLGTRAHDVHGSAYLTLEDADEPYNGGVKYHATPPMKRFMAMELLSGGERTMAALALLFSINQVSPTPFFVLDEVDAALDVGNVVKLGNYLKAHSTECQFIVVSLKEQLYHLADGLVGIYKDRAQDSSGTLTLDLRSFQS